MKNLLKNISTRTKNVAIGAGVVAGSVASSLPVFADGLDPAITAGFTSASSAVLIIIAAGVGASVAVIGASGGAKAGLKWIKGVFAKAS